MPKSPRTSKRSVMPSDISRREFADDTPDLGPVGRILGKAVAPNKIPSDTSGSSIGSTPVKTNRVSRKPAGDKSVKSAGDRGESPPAAGSPLSELKVPRPRDLMPCESKILRSFISYGRLHPDRVRALALDLVRIATEVGTPDRERNLNVSDASRILGVSRATVHNIRKHKPDFGEVRDGSLWFSEHECLEERDARL